MKQLFFGLVVFFMFVVTSHAGFEVLNNSTRLGVVNKVNCSTGINCTKGSNGLLTIDTDGALENQVTISASPTVLTSAQCGSTFLNSAEVEVDLPEASTVIGCRMTFVTTTATAFRIDPDDDDQIIPTCDATGDAVSNAALGRTITLQAVDGTNWVTLNGTSSFVDAN